eukprot:gb/GEZN01018756.1/.p1 GENE.gb/GEZN01018756.1/~~gb/GEZN01018756.1/.p1  ORF type:complete len:133 (-),score=15.50 gb/GEZN01018756.1/:207-605(-)
MRHIVQGRSEELLLSPASLRFAFCALSCAKRQKLTAALSTQDAPTTLRKGGTGERGLMDSCAVQLLPSTVINTSTPSATFGLASASVRDDWYCLAVLTDEVPRTEYAWLAEQMAALSKGVFQTLNKKPRPTF